MGTDKPPSYQQAMSSHTTPMNAQSMGATGGGPSTNSMISVNNLVYNLEPDLSVVTNATFKQHFFQQNEYTSSQRATCILNTGADYLDTRRSWLVFTLKYGNDLIADFGPSGSALNLINRVTVSSRSGDELSRCRRLNLKKASILPYKMDTEWWESVGQSMGKGTTLKTDNDYRFVIPLYCLSDLFGYGRFLPSMLTSGMRIEIEWENPEIAFNPKADPISGQTYKITDMHISARSIQLTDAVQRHLNELSATNGLEIVYTDWETTELANSSGDSINLEVRKAASRALKAYAKIRSTARNEGARDSMATQKFDCIQHQWQLGSLYFPHQPIKASDDDEPLTASQESYFHCLDSFAPKSGIYKSAVPLGIAPYIPLGEEATVDSTTPTQVDTIAVDRLKNATPFDPRPVFEFFDAGSKIVLVPDDPEQETVMRQLAGTGNATSFNVTVAIPPGAYRAFYLNDLGNRPNAFGPITSFQTNLSLLACCMERSALFNLSGIPINNSRILLLRATTRSTEPKDVTIFLQYVKLARIFLNNCEVEE